MVFSLKTSRSFEEWNSRIINHTAQAYRPVSRWILTSWLHPWVAATSTQHTGAPRSPRHRAKARLRGAIRCEHDRFIMGLFSKEEWKRLLADAGFVNIRTIPYPGEINWPTPVFVGTKPEQVDSSKLPRMRLPDNDVNPSRIQRE